MIGKVIVEGLGLGLLLVLVCVYAVNGARGFLTPFWQLLVILSVMNLIAFWWTTSGWDTPTRGRSPARRI